MTDLITRALRNATDTRAVVIGEGAVERTGEVFTELFGAARAIVVADERTFTLAGKRVSEALKTAGVELADPHIFPGEPELYAKYENCEALRDVLAPVDAIAVAVGSGTLNDITKRASGELGRPYLVVGTAASMDGYTAFGSSIALDGFKQTLSCPAPCGCVADLTAMADAPQVMTASGYGDLLGKIPAGADWILSDVLGIEAIDQGVWELVQGPLRGAVSRPAELAVGDVSATGELVEGAGHAGPPVEPPRFRGGTPVQPPVGDGGTRCGHHPQAPVPRLQGRHRHGGDRGPLRTAAGTGPHRFGHRRGRYGLAHPGGDGNRSS